MAVDVTIGAKTTGFSKGLAKMENEWAGFKGKLGRKFSFADAGKGLMMGLGIGSVDQIASTVTGLFQDAADAAQLMYERTASTLRTTQQLIGLKQTPGQQIISAEKDMRGQQAAIGRQQKLVDDLQNSPLRFISSEHRSMLRDANHELAQMQDRLAQSSVAVEQLKIAEKKRQQTLRDTRDELKDQRDLLENKTDHVGMAERAAARAYRLMREGFGTPGGEERTIDFERANLKVDQARKERELAQLRGIKGDSLARIGGGGNIFAPTNAQTNPANPAQAMVSEARKHTALLTDIKAGVTAKFGVQVSTLGLK